MFLAQYNQLNKIILNTIVALVIGFYSKNVIATILCGLLSYWIIIFFINQ